MHRPNDINKNVRLNTWPVIIGCTCLRQKPFGAPSKTHGVNTAFGFVCDGFCFFQDWRVLTNEETFINIYALIVVLC